MQEYIIRDYQKGFEQDQARIGITVASKVGVAVCIQCGRSCENPL